MMKGAMVAVVIGLLVTASPAAAADKTHQQMMAEIRMLQEQQAQLQQMLHGLADTLKTMTAKIELAKEITARFHGTAAADRAEANFRSRSQKRETPAEVATRVETIDEPTISLARLLKQVGLVESTSAAHRLIEQGGVKIDGEKIDNPKTALGPGPARLFQVGKRGFLRVEVVQRKS